MKFKHNLTHEHIRVELEKMGTKIIPEAIEGKLQNWKVNDPNFLQDIHKKYSAFSLHSITDEYIVGTGKLRRKPRITKTKK